MFGVPSIDAAFAALESEKRLVAPINEAISAAVARVTLGGRPQTPTDFRRVARDVGTAAGNARELAQVYGRIADALDVISSGLAAAGTDPQNPSKETL